MPESIANLPIADVAEQVCLSLQHKNVLLSAEAGAGKSTGLPLVLMQVATPNNRIVMLEPRRLAAIGVAERLASLVKEPLGQSVGLRMRGQTSVSNNTKLEVVTEGVLTRLLQSDPTLEGIGWIIFDEFHERSMHADLGLALCLDVQQSIRDNLRLLLMSATIDMDELGTSLGDVEKISCKGRTYPVDIRWLGDTVVGSATRNTHRNSLLASQVVNAIKQALHDDEGDILVFLPSVADLARCATLLRSITGSDDVAVFQLHGRADASVQRAATAPAPANHRRVILSTSIAETSITIDGVRVVIDTGLERLARINNHTGTTQLETVSASQASAIQRAGRAGRTSSGVCYRLWSEHDHMRRARSWQPEILRADLSLLLVELGLWGVIDKSALPWLVPPPDAALASAKQLLNRLGLWQDDRLTRYGKLAAALPVHPRLAHMLLWAAERNAAPLACHVAVLLEEGARAQQSTDLDSMIKNRLNRQQQHRVSQLTKALKKTTRLVNADEQVHGLGVGALLAQAFPDWIAQRRPGHDARYALSGGAGAYLDNDDALAQQPWLCVASMGGAKKEARIFVGCSVSIKQLQAYSPELFSNVKHVEWDDQQARIVAEQRECIGSLVVSAKMLSNISDDDTAPAMLDVIRKRGLALLPWTDEARQWQARVQLMATIHTPKPDKKWPNVDDEHLLSSIDEWLGIWLTGIRSLKGLSQLNLLAILQARLDYQQQQLLESWLPVRYTVPSGSNIRLRYALNEPPVLSVKLQEMLSCNDNPSIAQGNVVLKVELLSPARRPVQVTTDLKNFWTNSYPSVKKDLAGRYPKHDWPDDPLAAVPTAYAKRRKPK